MGQQPATTTTARGHSAPQQAAAAAAVAQTPAVAPRPDNAAFPSRIAGAMQSVPGLSAQSAAVPWQVTSSFLHAGSGPQAASATVAQGPAAGAPMTRGRAPTSLPGRPRPLPLQLRPQPPHPACWTSRRLLA